MSAAWKKKKKAVDNVLAGSKRHPHRSSGVGQITIMQHWVLFSLPDMKKWVNDHCL
jgi:hypothetical protein